MADENRLFFLLASGQCTYTLAFFEVAL